jgi:hypothetical protein
MSAPCSDFIGKPLTVGMVSPVLPLRVALPLDFLLAEVFSSMTMVMVSPTKNARRSSYRLSFAWSG